MSDDDVEMTEIEFPKSLMISGGSGDGKSTSLMNLKDQEGVIYLNCDGGKPLPFKNKFCRMSVDDPYEIYGVFDEVENDETEQHHTIIIDTASFMMDRYESLHIIGAVDTMKGWANYAQFFKNLMNEYVAKSRCFVIFLGHLEGVLNEERGVTEYKVPVKGALSKNGLEAYFTTVVNCRKVTIREIEKNAKEGNLLTITKRERALGFKHVFQTQTLKNTVGDRIRSPLGLFDDDEAFINNDAQKLIEHLTKYYE